MIKGLFTILLGLFLNYFSYRGGVIMFSLSWCLTIAPFYAWGIYTYIKERKKATKEEENKSTKRFLMWVAILGALILLLESIKV